MSETAARHTDDRGVEYIEHVTDVNSLPTGWALCYTCHRGWNDSVSTSVTPAPSARCPFEYLHEAPTPAPEGAQYQVSLRNTFDADSPEDALRQFVAWAVDNAYSAGYRVTVVNADGTDGPSEFIDADDVNWMAHHD